MNYLKRALVCERLRISLQSSYRVVGHASYGARISSDFVIELLNRSRRGSEKVLTELPSDILTADELATDPVLSGSDITAHDLVTWSNRTRNPLPHFRINKQVRRFRRESVIGWLNERTIKRRSA